MPGKRTFDAQLAALDALRHGTSGAPETVKALRHALGDRNNYIVAKAADLVRELRLAELLPDLLAAFERFFTDRSDPQCWAKNALSRALAELDCQEAAVFLRGMRHVQLEPVWGGSADTAGALRATCALAMVQCRSLPDQELLANLIELLADEEKSVRAEVVQAIAQVGSSQAALLLRLRAVLAGEEPEVLGACFAGILSVEGTPAIAWLSRFLDRGDDVAAEAALAVAQDRSPEAFQVLRERFELIEIGPLRAARTVPHARSADPAENTLRSRGGRDDDPWFQSVLLSAIALTRQDAAQAFLLDLVRNDSGYAESAIEAILRSGPPPELVDQIEAIVKDKPHLAQALATRRPKGRGNARA